MSSREEPESQIDCSFNTSYHEHYGVQGRQGSQGHQPDMLLQKTHAKQNLKTGTCEHDDGDNEEDCDGRPFYDQDGVPFDPQDEQSSLKSIVNETQYVEVEDDSQKTDAYDLSQETQSAMAQLVVVPLRHDSEASQSPKDSFVIRPMVESTSPVAFKFGAAKPPQINFNRDTLVAHAPLANQSRIDTASNRNPKRAATRASESSINMFIDRVLKSPQMSR
jgi:hypothetical protein